MDRIQYTGLNYMQVREFTGGRVMAPYECMGFSMLSLMMEDGTTVTVNEGDWIVRDANGKFSIE